MSRVGVIVLASGFSRRFGEDNKLLMPLGTKTVIQEVMDEIQALDLSKHKLCMVTQYQEIIEVYKRDKRIKIAINKQAHKGISSSIKLGVEAVGQVDGYMFIPADQIGITCELLTTLIEIFKKKPNHIIVPIYNNKPGSPKIFPKSYKEDLLSLQGDEGGRQIIKDDNSQIHHVIISDASGNKDIDTLKDYNEIREARK